MRETHLLLHILQYFDAYRVFKLPGNMPMNTQKEIRNFGPKTKYLKYKIFALEF